MVRKTVRFSLLLFDDFTGKCILNGGHLFQLDGKFISPIRKPDGFYVFTEPCGSSADVKISGGAYYPDEVKINLDELDPLFPVVKRRLMRRRGAGFTDCEFIEGIFKPNEVVYALKKTAANNRLLDITNGDKDETIISLSGYFAQGAGETRFMVGTGKHQELITTGPMLPDKTYPVVGNFKFWHKPGETAVRVYSSCCDENGYFAIPVEKGQKDLIDQILFYNKEEEKWGCSSLTGPS